MSNISNRILKSPYIVLDKTAVPINNEVYVPVPQVQEFIEEPGEIPEEDIYLPDNERAERIVERAKAEAERIMHSAREDAELILDRMEADAQKALKQLEEEVRERGYADGYAQGMAETETIKEDARTLYANAVRERQESLDALEPDIVDLTVGIIEKLLTDMVNINPQVVLCLIRRGFTESRLSGDVTIHVSDADYDEVNANRDTFVQYADAGAKIDVLKDFSLKHTDCIIETPYGAIDCSLDQQYDALKKNLYYIFENR